MSSIDIQFRQIVYFALVQENLYVIEGAVSFAKVVRVTIRLKIITQFWEKWPKMLPEPKIKPKYMRQILAWKDKNTTSNHF
jgi:hypothetical protein